MLKEIKTLPNNPELVGLAELFRDIQYSENGQKLNLLVPWSVNQLLDKKQKHPLIVFVQGSGWTKPNIDYKIPLLSHFAEAGYVVASVSHRNYRDGYQAPAYLVDVKTAIRFLRANADKYGIDKDKVMIMGTSSGGNTSLLVGLTADDPLYKSEEYADESDSVAAVIDIFGPTDLLHRFFNANNREEAAEVINNLLKSNDEEAKNHVAALEMALDKDHDKWIPLLESLSPSKVANEKNSKIPFLLMHGTADNVVNVEQLDRMYNSLKTANADVEAYYIEDGIHGSNFWSPEVREAIRKWIAEKFPI